MNWKRIMTIVILQMIAYYSQSQITLTRDQAEQIDKRLTICYNLYELNDSLLNVVRTFDLHKSVMNDRMRLLQDNNSKLQRSCDSYKQQDEAMLTQIKFCNTKIAVLQEDLNKSKLKAKKQKRLKWVFLIGGIVGGTVTSLVLR
ncbi:MAG: hypothetical protein GY827_08445 [Cytophagales bacterium]|nr:hypothetical protein [Cytophagales bacterium]